MQTKSRDKVKGAVAGRGLEPLSYDRSAIRTSVEKSFEFNEFKKNLKVMRHEYATRLGVLYYL